VNPPRRDGCLEPKELVLAALPACRSVVTRVLRSLYRAMGVGGSVVVRMLCSLRRATSDRLWSRKAGHLDSIRAGLTNREIAARLVIAESTA
jgi:DNA-binding NarL/FixJ family response regulator